MSRKRIGELEKCTKPKISRKSKQEHQETDSKKGKGLKACWKNKG